MARLLPDRRQRGQAMVEFALMVPLLMVTLITLTDIARAVFDYNVISNAAREGAREAVVAYNQASNSAPSGAAPADATLVGVIPAIRRAGAGVLHFNCGTSSLTLCTDATTGSTGTKGQAPSCTVFPNQGCLWIFVVGSTANSGVCLSPATGGANPPNTPFTGPGPNDIYSQCDYGLPRASGNHDVVVEIEYRFQPFGLILQPFNMWAKSEMRTEY